MSHGYKLRRKLWLTLAIKLPRLKFGVCLHRGWYGKHDLNTLPRVFASRRRYLLPYKTKNGLSTQDFS